MCTITLLCLLHMFCNQRQFSLSLNFISCTKLGLLGSHYFIEFGVATEIYVVGNLVSPPFYIPYSL